MPKKPAICPQIPAGSAKSRFSENAQGPSFPAQFRILAPPPFQPIPQAPFSAPPHHCTSHVPWCAFQQAGDFPYRRSRRGRDRLCRLRGFRSSRGQTRPGVCRPSLTFWFGPVETKICPTPPEDFWASAQRRRKSHRLYPVGRPAEAGPTLVYQPVSGHAATPTRPRIFGLRHSVVASPTGCTLWEGLPKRARRCHPARPP